MSEKKAPVRKARTIFRFYKRTDYGKREKSRGGRGGNISRSGKGPIKTRSDHFFSLSVRGEMKDRGKETKLGFHTVLIVRTGTGMPKNDMNKAVESGNSRGFIDKAKVRLLLYPSKKGETPEPQNRIILCSRAQGTWSDV